MQSQILKRKGGVQFSNYAPIYLVYFNMCMYTCKVSMSLWSIFQFSHYSLILSFLFCHAFTSRVQTVFGLYRNWSILQLSHYFLSSCLVYFAMHLQVGFRESLAYMCECEKKGGGVNGACKLA